MDLEARRDVVYRRTTGTCREGLTNTIARCLDRPTACRHPVHTLSRPDAQTPPPRRFATRRDFVHRRTAETCRGDLTNAIARCLDRPSAPPSRALPPAPWGETSPPRRFATQRDVVHRRTAETCPVDLTNAIARCLDRSSVRRHAVPFPRRPDGGDATTTEVCSPAGRRSPPHHRHAPGRPHGRHGQLRSAACAPPSGAHPPP